MVETPVALIIFNRPEPTAAVFAEIAKARPSRLFVIADGPRSDRPGEAERCAAARAITEQIDWPCEVRRDYAEANLGCRDRIVTGINWVFDQVEEAIILEDDCVPRQSFFRFCDEMIHRYRDDERVMMVSGRYSQFQAKELANRFRYSYEFVYGGNCWGWATWRRAWQHFDITLDQWPRLRDTSWLEDMFPDKEVHTFRREIFAEAHSAVQSIDAWDYQWTFSMWARHGLAVVPAVHLISNVGFGDDATHTRSGYNHRGRLLGEDLAFPLNHPPCVERNAALDHQIEALVLRQPRRPRVWHERLRRGLWKAMKRLYLRSHILQRGG